MKKRTIAAVISMFVCAGIGFSAVKGPNYYGLRSMGMGNTTVAVTTNRTAIFHNPAGLGLLKNKIEVSISPLIFSIDGKLITILRAMNKYGDSLSDISNIGHNTIETINDLDGEWVGFEWIPEITVATNNLGFGVYTVLPVGVRIESGHLIPKLGFRGERDLVFTWAVGVPLKSERTHMGISVEYLQRTPLEETITTYSETFNYFDEMGSNLLSSLGIINDMSNVKHGVSFDIGMMHDLKGFRLAYDIKDILGVIGGKIVVPPQFDIGVAYYFPQLENVEYIENLIIAFEFSDLFGIEPVTEKFEHPAKKIHLGAELDLKYVALRLGCNQGYPTAGLGLRLGLFMLDYVFFTKEMGYYPGQLPKRQHVLSMGIGFKTARPERKERGRDIDEYDESMYEESPVRKPPVPKPQTTPAPKQTALTQETAVPAPSPVPVEPAPVVEEEPAFPEETTEETVETPQGSNMNSDESTDDTVDSSDDIEETTDEDSSEEDIGWE